MENSDDGPDLLKHRKIRLLTEQKKDTCFRCGRTATGESFLNMMMMNVCLPCHTVWPKEGDSFDFGDRPLKASSKQFFFGTEIT